MRCLRGVSDPGTNWNEWVRYPFQPGYSMAGTVIEVGAEVSSFCPRDRIVTQNPHSQFFLAAEGDVNLMKIPGGHRHKRIPGEFYYGKAGIVRRCGAPGGWFGTREFSGGGPLIDLGPHIIDLAMLTMGGFEPVSVYARTFCRTESLGNVKYHGSYQAAEQGGGKTDVEELASAIINAKNGACLLIETSNCSHIQNEGMYMQLLGTKGGVELEPELKIATTVNDCLMDMNPVIDCAEFDYSQGIVDEIQHFADCIAGKCECMVPAKAGYTLMRVIEAAYRSAKSGQVERI